MSKYIQGQIEVNLWLSSIIDNYMQKENLRKGQFLNRRLYNASLELLSDYQKQSKEDFRTAIEITSEPMQLKYRTNI